MEAEKSLASEVIAQSQQSSDDDNGVCGARQCKMALWTSMPHKNTGTNIKSVKRVITGCDDEERMSERIVKNMVDVLSLWSWISSDRFHRIKFASAPSKISWTSGTAGCRGESAPAGTGARTSRGSDR